MTASLKAMVVDRMMDSGKVKRRCRSVGVGTDGSPETAHDIARHSATYSRNPS